MVGTVARCPVCGGTMKWAYIFRAGKWVKVGHYCEACRIPVMGSKA